MEDLQNSSTGSEAPKQGNDVEDNKLMAAVGYISILCIVPLLLAKDSPYAKFHGKQGLVLFIITVIVSVVGGIIPFLGWFIIIPVGYLAIFILSIIGIVKALQGEKWVMPGVSQLADMIKI